jgi:hypothetical protein
VCKNVAVCISARDVFYTTASNYSLARKFHPVQEKSLVIFSPIGNPRPITIVDCKKGNRSRADSGGQFSSISRHPTPVTRERRFLISHHEALIVRWCDVIHEQRTRETGGRSLKHGRFNQQYNEKLAPVRR